jgi:hypothetical protein
VNGDEVCDNGSGNSLTGTCSPTCTVTYCGDDLTQNPNGAGTAGVTGTGDEVCDGDYLTGSNE